MSSIKRQLGIAANPLEQIAANEDRLVAGGNAAQPRAPVHHPLDDAQQAVAAVDAHVEASPGGTGRERAADQLVGRRRQRRIGMQKEQDFALAGTCAHRVHLQSHGRAGASSSRSTSGRASSAVPSPLPPSTTSTSAPRVAQRLQRRQAAPVSVAASFSTGRISERKGRSRGVCMVLGEEFGARSSGCRQARTG
jgi:hypothetical protein